MRGLTLQQCALPLFVNWNALKSSAKRSGMTNYGEVGDSNSNKIHLPF